MVGGMNKLPRSKASGMVFSAGSSRQPTIDLDHICIEI
jgi:hypothetical protein